VLANFRNREALRSIAFNFVVFAVVNYAIARQVNVDNAGHIGGFVAGVTLCLLSFAGLVVVAWQQVLILLLLPLTIAFVPKGQLRYYEAYNIVASADTHLQSINDQLLTDDQRADSLRNGVLPELNAAITSLRALNDIPAAVAIDTS